MFDITCENLKWAYKKLKKYFYYYNSSNYLKDKILKFENELNNNTFEKLSKELNNMASLNHDMVSSKNIRFKIYPKKDVATIGSTTQKVEITDFNIFIDMPLSFYLVDILFTLDLLETVPSENLKYSYGNKFDERLYASDINILTNSLLFSNHNKNYNDWKKSIYKGLSENSDKNKIVIKLDIKKCFYNVYFNLKEFILKIFSMDYKSDYVIKIMCNIYRYFSKIIDAELNLNVDLFKKENYVHLPVGLFSSYAILNILFSDFDYKIASNSISYARYVDDILIVKELNDNEDENKKITIADLFNGEIFLNDKIYALNNIDFGKMIINPKKIETIYYRRGETLRNFSKKISKIIRPSLDFDDDSEEESEEEGIIEIGSSYSLKYLRNKIYSIFEKSDEEANEIYEFLDNIRYNEWINLFSQWEFIFNNLRKIADDSLQKKYYDIITNAINSISINISNSKISYQKIENNLKNTLITELNYSYDKNTFEKIHLLSQSEIINYIYKKIMKEISFKEDICFPIDVTYNQICFYISVFGNISLHEILSLANQYYMLLNNYQYANKIVVDVVPNQNVVQFIYKRNKAIAPVNDVYATSTDGGNVISKLKEAESVKIAVANLNLKLKELEKTDLSGDFPKTYKLFDLKRIIKTAKKLGAEVVVFPEFAIPFNSVFDIISYASRMHISLIGGITHIYYASKSVANVTLIIDSFLNITLGKFKNYFSDLEKFLCVSNGYWFYEPKEPYYYIIDNGKYKYSTMTCFESTNINDRAILCDKIEVLYMPVFNKDTNYFSNIIGSYSRDASCFIVQSNTNEYGDSRITAPYKEKKMDIVKLKGGENNYLVIGNIDLKGLKDKHQKGLFFENRLLDLYNKKITQETFQQEMDEYKKTKEKPIAAGNHSDRWSNNIR